MSRFDDIDASIEKLLSMKSGSTFIANGKWKCKILDYDGSPKWKKDINSPSLMLELHVSVVDDADEHDGAVVVQRDVGLSRKYYASLCIRDDASHECKKMLTVVGISFSA